MYVCMSKFFINFGEKCFFDFPKNAKFLPTHHFQQYFISFVSNIHENKSV